MHVLVYSPRVFGHPQVYCLVMAGLLRARGCRVTLLLGIDSDDGLRDWPDLRRLARDPGIAIWPCRDHSADGGVLLTAEELVRVQEASRADATLFVDGDLSKPEFVRISDGLAPRLLGRTAAVFGQTAPWYPGEEFYSGRPLPRYAPTVRENMGRVKRFLFHRRESPAYFFETVLLKHRVLDVLLVKDERVAERFGPPVIWLPEIYRPLDQVETEEHRQEYDTIAPELRRFVQRHSGREVLLFFGRGAWYRGYDFFLELARRDEAVCAVHCGEDCVHEPGKPFAFDVQGVRRTLLEQGRLFETRKYIHGQRLVELFFSVTGRLVSTHRLTGSSGTLLQALELGKPVLVPGSGLLGQRVVANGLGRTYAYGEMDDLERHWRAFSAEDPRAYSSSIREFMARFAPARLADTLHRAVTGEPAHAAIPG
jgi:hypothetical protein